MCIETSQTFYDCGRDVELSAEAVVLLRVHPSLVEMGEAVNSCRAWINASLLVCTVFLPSDRLPFCDCVISMEPFRKNETSNFVCTFLLLLKTHTHTKQNPLNPSSESSWQGFGVYCKEIKGLISFFIYAANFVFLYILPLRQIYRRDIFGISQRESVNPSISLQVLTKPAFRHWFWCTPGLW